MELSTAAWTFVEALVITGILGIVVVCGLNEGRNWLRARKRKRHQEAERIKEMERKLLPKTQVPPEERRVTNPMASATIRAIDVASLPPPPELSPKLQRLTSLTPFEGEPDETSGHARLMKRSDIREAQDHGGLRPDNSEADTQASANVRTRTPPPKA